MAFDYRIQQFFASERLAPGLSGDAPVAALLLPGARRATDVPCGMGPAQAVAMRQIDALLNGWLPQEQGRPRAFYALSNGGQYIAPVVAGRALRARGPQVSRRRGRAHLVGMAASLMVFDRLSFGADGARMAELYFCLHDYMRQVPYAMRMCSLLTRFSVRFSDA